MKRFLVFMGMSLFCLLSYGNDGSAIGRSTHADLEAKTKVVSVQIPFIENKGQIHPEVAFYAQTFGGTYYITKSGELVLSLPSAVQGDRNRLSIRETLQGAQIKVIAGKEKSRTGVSYFKGTEARSWRVDAPTYDIVDLGQVYDGIELNLKAHGNNVEKRFFVKPGADPTSIKVDVAGAETVRVNSEGGLTLETPLGMISLTRPVAYQMIDGRRHPVDVAYHVAGTSYSFRVGDYDRKQELVIDPLIQSTYLGGGGNRDRGYSVAVHPDSGEVYVAGLTDSTDFPVTETGVFTTYEGNGDVFIAILNPELTSIVQATYYGGSGEEAAGSGDGSPTIAFHPTNGDVYVTGYTSSAGLPGIFGSAQPAKSGGIDAFVAWFSPDLATLHRTTYLGGSSDDIACTIAFRPTHYFGQYYLYVVGRTRSTNLPGITGWSYQQNHAGGTWDAFVGRISADLSQFKTSYLGGTDDDWGYGIAIRPEPLDLTYNVYVTGYTESVDFPGTRGGAQRRLKGGKDCFVALLCESLQSLKQSTYLGGTGEDEPRSIAIGSLGLGGPVYITGTTYSTDFPFTSGGAQRRHGGGGRDAFVALLNADLVPPAFATYIGGTSDDRGAAVTVSPLSGEVYVVGETSSTNFPKTTGGAQDTQAGQLDAFVARFSLNLGTLRQSTYLGGDSQEFARGVTVHPATGDVYVAGITASTDFPGATDGAQDVYGGGGQDGFVARFDPGLAGSGLRIITPNGGESIPSGSSRAILWSALPGMATFSVKYKWEGMTTWEPIATRTNDTTCEWVVPTPTKNRERCVVKVTAYDDGGRRVATDLSDSYFTVEVASIISPNGGQILTPGEHYAIQWNTNGTVREVVRTKLQYSITGSAPWIEITELDGNPGSLDWTVPAVVRDSVGCKVRVDLLDARDIIVATDTSDRPFTINGSVRVLSPNGGEVLTPGDITPITWTTHYTGDEVAEVRLYYSLLGRSPWKWITSLPGNPETYDWTVPGVVRDSRGCKVRIELLSAGSVVLADDVSDENFLIWGSVQLVSPNGGETLTSGQFWMITWDTYPTSRPVRSVRLLYTKDYEAHWETIMSMADNYGSWSWRVPTVRERKDACKVKIELRDADGVLTEDKSLGYFKIDPAP